MLPLAVVYTARPVLAALQTICCRVSTQAAIVCLCVSFFVISQEVVDGFLLSVCKGEV